MAKPNGVRILKQGAEQHRSARYPGLQGDSGPAPTVLGTLVHDARNVGTHPRVFTAS